MTDSATSVRPACAVTKLRHAPRAIRQRISAGRSLVLAVVVAGASAVLPLGSAQTPAALAAGTPTPAAFSCEGGAWKAYTVPSGFTELYIQAGGAEGGHTGISGSITHGGTGGSVQAIVQVTPGQTMGVLVGCLGGVGESKRRWRWQRFRERR